MKIEKKYLNLTSSLIFKVFLNIFIVFYIAKKVSVSEFGSFTIAFIFSAITILFLDYGFNLRSLILSGSKEGNIAAELWSMLYSKVLLVLLLLPMGMLFYFISPYDALTDELIYVLVISAIPNSFGNYFLNAFKINNNYALEARGYAIQFFTLIIVLIAFEYSMETTVFHYAIGLLIARVCYFLYGIGVFTKMFPRAIGWNFNRSISSVRTATSFAVHMILSALIIHIDTFILSVLSDLEQVGIYQAGMRIVMASMLIAVIISDAFIPEISKLINQKGEAHKRLIKLFNFISLFALLTVITLYFYKTTLITLLFSEEYLVLENSIFIILAIIALRYFGIVPGIILTSFGQQRIRAIAVVASILVSIILNLILIPRYGIIGAFTASLFAHIILNLLYLVFSSRTVSFYSKFSYKLIIGASTICFLAQIFFFKDSLVYLIATIFMNTLLIGFFFLNQKSKFKILL
ncbi:polysaccharide biosynthesis C-terminal domain-containing protein [Muriicola sp. E247]|uniref:oligosaccharide flippase family protein n=1 Tax=Muriicola sp. E247 TaxID=3242730 RepID=UPI003526B78F